MPLNSLLPVSASIFEVAPRIFFSTSLMWSERLPLLFMISPRYLYVVTSSRVSPFRFSLLFFLFLFLLLCILLLRIVCGTSVLHGWSCQAFLVVFPGHGGLGIHRPSIEESRYLSFHTFLGLVLSFLVPSISHLLTLHTLWLIGRLLVWCCLWYLFFLSGHSGSVFLLLGLSLVSWSSWGFSLLLWTPNLPYWIPATVLQILPLVANLWGCRWDKFVLFIFYFRLLFTLFVCFKCSCLRV